MDKGLGEQIPGAGQNSTHHSNVVEVVNEEDGAQLLGLEGAGQLHEQVHASIPHAIQVVIQLPILQQITPLAQFAAENSKAFVSIKPSVDTYSLQYCSNPAQHDEVGLQSLGQHMDSQGKFECFTQAQASHHGTALPCTAAALNSTLQS